METEEITLELPGRNYATVEVAFYPNVGWCSSYCFWLNSHYFGFGALPKFGVFETRDAAIMQRFMEIIEVMREELRTNYTGGDKSMYYRVIAWAKKKQQYDLFSR